MAIDALSIAAIIVSLIVAVAVYWLATNFNRQLDRKLRRLAKHQEALLNSAEARELCRLIRDQYPNACAGLDFTVEAGEAGFPRIAEWRLDGPKPSEEALLQRTKASGEKTPG